MKHAYGILLVVLSLVACGGGGDSKPSNTAGEPGAQAAATGTPFAGTSDCDAAWNAYVTSQPQGLTKEYRIRSRMSFMGHERVATEQTQREVVQLSNAEQVRLVTTSTSDGHADVHDSTITRSEFLATCRQGLPPQPEDDFRIEVLERARQTIKVAAGTFHCEYVKMRMTPREPEHELGGEVVSETWTELPEHGSLLVKSVTTTEHTQQGQKLLSRTELELISLRRP